jgi:hypothetical protein
MRELSAAYCGMCGATHSATQLGSRWATARREAAGPVLLRYRFIAFLVMPICTLGQRRGPVLLIAQLRSAHGTNCGWFGRLRNPVAQDLGGRHRPSRDTASLYGSPVRFCHRESYSPQEARSVATVAPPRFNVRTCASHRMDFSRADLRRGRQHPTAKCPSLALHTHSDVIRHPGQHDRHPP